MDRLTAIKIKYEDGTYSDEIPIYVTAENVEYNNEYSLIETLGYIDIKKDGNIQQQINKITSISARIPTLENRIANIQGGTPTVVDDISDMIDTDQIYIFSTDSKWYYYDLTSSAWVAGGVYGSVPTDTTLTQSGVPADAKAVGDEFADLKSALNVIENGGTVVLPFEYINGGYIQDFSPGNVVSYTGWKYSDYIDISGNNGTLYCTMVSGSTPTIDGSSYNAFYDANKTYISRLQTINGEVTVPDGAVYVRVSCRNTYTQTLAVAKIGIRDEVENVKSVDNDYIKMVTWNVGIFKDGTNKPTAEEAPAQIAKFLRTIGQCNADIINMQEYAYYVGQNHTYESRHLIDFKYPYELHFPAGATKTGSKYATSALTKITFNSGSNRECYYCDINIKGKTITLINAHLSIELNPSTYRNADIAQLITFMNTKERVILSGDFNVASDSEFDAFKTAGYTLCNGGNFGWFDTWPVRENMWDGFTTDWPCYHLDNIIVSNNIIPQYAEAVESDISDHAPFMAILKIN